MSDYLRGCDETIIGAAVNAAFGLAPKPAAAAVNVAVKPAGLLTRPPSPTSAAANVVLSPPKPTAAASAAATALKPPPPAASSAAQSALSSVAKSKAANATSKMNTSVQRLRASASKNKKLGAKVNAIANALSKKSDIVQQRAALQASRSSM